MKKALLVIVSIAGCSWLMSYTNSYQTTKAQRDTLYSKLTDEQKRLPKNAVAGLEVSKGLAVTLFASEPMMGNPTNIDIDSRGRVWVCEAYNYRNQYNPNNPKRAEGDRILILEDTDGDGKADREKVFYQGNEINAALGIAVLGNKVIVSCSPNVFVLTDTDGDDVADKKEILFSHMKGEQHDHGVHSFTFGPDGKLYFNTGNEGMQIFDKNGKPIVDKDGKEVNSTGNPYRQGMIFRVNLDGTDFEVLGHNFRNNYEVAVDSYGTMWQSDNDDDGNQGVRINYVMPYGNYGFTDEMTGAGWQADRINVEKEIPKRHWHQNDPGSIPNLLQTGAGSPTGMVIYEGDLLPEVYRNQMIHSDAGPNVVRAYPVKADGAGYQASIVNILKGTRDQWFRPSDVGVAPDGSLFVADWYDPGVGGHQMGDVNRGRIFRVSPPNTPYKIAKIDVSNTKGAIEALKNPNLATRYLAWQKLHAEGKKAESALKKMWTSDSNPRFRARALWLLAKIPGKSKTYVEQALKDPNSDIRITGLRIALQEEKDIIPYVKQLVKDPNAQVRREAVIALRHHKSPEAAGLWTDFAVQYDGNDRWYLEALGIGADNQWDTFLANWLAKAGPQLQTAAGRDIVWRSRTGLALPLLSKYITDDQTSASDRLKYFRAFDFIKDPQKENVLIALMKNQGSHKNEIILTSLRLLSPETIAKSAELSKILNQTLESQKNSPEYLGLVERFQAASQNPQLLKMALKDPEGNNGVAAGRILINLGGSKLIKSTIQANDENAKMALTNLGKIGNKQALDLLQETIENKSNNLALKQHAVQSLMLSWSGQDRLAKLFNDKLLTKDLEPSAIYSLSQSNRSDIRNTVLSLSGNNKSTGGKALPSISELIKITGNPEKGTAVYTKLCSSCHVAGNQGAQFGPALTQIGSKLPKDGIYLAILHPDAGISFGFEGYRFKLKDGSETVGIISSSTADALEVTVPGGSKTSYKKSDIITQKQLANSLMPSGLEQAMTQEELTDLVEYLYSLKASK